MDALAIFSLDINITSTPNWYPGTKEHGREVPTWNYVVVHAYGPLTAIQDDHWLADQRGETYQHPRSSIACAPWKVSDAPEEFIKISVEMGLSDWSCQSSAF